MSVDTPLHIVTADLHTLARYSKERLIELKYKWAAIRNLLISNNNSVEDDES